MRVHVVPASDAYGRKHYTDTVQLKVNKSKINEFVKDKKITDLLIEENYAIWGVKKGKSNVNHTKWLRMNRGDICLFYRDKRFFSAGKVLCKFENYEFSKDLWGGIPRNSDIDPEETWEDMFLLDEVKRINIPLEMFNHLMGYKEGNIIQGYNNYEESISELIIDEFELYNWQTSSLYDPSSSAEDNQQRIQNLLDNLTSTDTTSSGGQSRKEQSLHREHHFGNKKNTKCSLCHRELPTNLLHAGHIKPRRDCSENERKDLNVTMPICKLGCDDLFEKGYIYVDSSGSIRINDTRDIPSELRKFLIIYDGKKCLHFNEKTKGYFESKNNDVL